MVIIPLVILLGTSPPLRVKALRANALLMSYCNMIAGSILLGFGIMHVLPDCVGDYEASYQSSVTVNGGSYPVPYGLALTGFFMMIAIERYLIQRMEGLRKDATKAAYVEVAATETIPSTHPGVVTDDCACPPGNCCCVASPQTDVEQIGRDVQPVVVAELRAEGAGETSSLDTSTATLVIMPHEKQPAEEHHHHDHSAGFHTHDVPLNTKNPYAPYVLTFGLSFHSIFEGIALGLTDDVLAMGLLMLAIDLHKIGEAFAMGMSFLKYGISTMRWILMVSIFCLVCPLGIAIGLGITQGGLDDYTQSAVSSILNSFAVGVFMYVSILGIMVEELGTAKGKHIFFKIGIALSIAALLGCLTFLGA